MSKKVVDRKKAKEDIALIPDDLGEKKGNPLLPVISSLNLDEEVIPSSLPALEDGSIYEIDTLPFTLDDEDEETKKEIPASMPELEEKEEEEDDEEEEDEEEKEEEDDEEEEESREEELKGFIKEIDESKEFSEETLTFIVKIVEELEGRIVDFSKEETNKFIKSMPKNGRDSVRTLFNKENKQTVNFLKGAIVRVLYDLIIEEVIEIEDVTPWDVKRKLQENKAYSDLYKIDKSKKLEVVVTVEEKEFKHELAEECVFGLLVYSKITKYPIDIKMFGHTLTLPKRVEKKPEKENYFQASVKKTSFFFETPSFMQGVNTGAMWADEHTKPVFSKITEHNSEGEFDIVVE